MIGSVTHYAEQHHNLAQVVLLIAGAAIFFWVFSIIIYIATFARFKLRRNGKLALIEHGLLTRRWRTVLLPHVQALTFVESPAQQLVNDGSLRMTLPGTTRASLERTMLLPAVDRTVIIDVLNRLFVDLDPGVGDTLRTLENTMQRLPPSARRSYLLRWVWRLLPICLILMLLMYVVPGGPTPMWGLLPLAIFGPIGAWLGNIRFKDAGWRLDDAGRLVVRERALSRTTRSTRRQRLVWTRISMLRKVSGRNVTFVTSVAGAGSRPGIKAKLLGMAWWRATIAGCGCAASCTKTPLPWSISLRNVPSKAPHPNKQTELRTEARHSTLASAAYAVPANVRGGGTVTFL